MPNKVAVLASIAIASSASIASAQPGAEPPPGTPATVIIIDPNASLPPAAPMPPAVAPVAPPATAAPQNESWENVSHINGQVVPVGSRNEYTYKFRRTNLAANPVGWIFDIYGFSASVALSDNIALRGDITFMGDSEGDGTDIAVSLPIYLRRTYQGPFLEPGVISRNMEYEDQAGPMVMVGWHWMYDSGLNLAVAFGAGRDVTKDGPDDYGDEIIPNGYMRFGYAF